MKIGRNEPCPCGSGKKFKKCCIDKYNADEVMQEQSIFMHDSFDLLTTFAGLSIFPANHGKYVRFEELSFLTLQKYNQGKPIENSILKKFLDNNYSSHYLEDPVINMFTDIVTFHGGDYIVFPGITEYDTFILSNLLAAIFHWPDSNIPDEFRKHCYQTTKFILSISDAIAHRLGYQRYMDVDTSHDNIIIPNDNILLQLKNSVMFHTSEIQSLLTNNSISKEVAEAFILNLRSAAIEQEESPLLYQPLVRLDDYYIVASPTTLTFALTDLIWSEAEKMGCMQQVNSAYQKILWNKFQFYASQFGFRSIYIDNITLLEYEGLYQFDNDKVAFVQFISDGGANYKIKQNQITRDEKEFTTNDIHKSDVFNSLTKHFGSLFDFFYITVLSPIGRELFFLFKKTDSSQRLVMTIHDIEILWNLRNTSALDLWKFANAREEQLHNVPALNFSFLDYYKLYKDHNDSFYLSDETVPSILYIEPGYGGEFIKTAKLKADKHSVLKSIRGRMVNVQVIRKDKYAPVYVDVMGLAGRELEFMVDGYYQSIWVKANDIIDNTTKNLDVYWQMTDAIAYWLWQIQDNLKEFIRPLGAPKPLMVSFNLHPKDKFESFERNLTREENLIDKFQTSATKDSINIIIPSEINPYLYGADNEGERTLIKVLLTAFNKLLSINNITKIPADNIINILNTDVPLGMKKKIFILDTNDNLLLDPRNLEDIRYIQDYDVEVVMNSIIQALGSDCPSVGEINDKKTKATLCSNVVQKALLPKLKKLISKFNSQELLERLISLNESLIRDREHQRVIIPTRIACFVTIEQQEIDLKESLEKINRTSIAVRCLIEHVAAEQNNDNSILSISAIDEMIALMDQIISWGSLGDQINYDLFDIKMGILPSGRIGTEKGALHKVFDPYYKSKTKENVIDSIKLYEQVFPQRMNLLEKTTPEFLDNAFKEDFGISFNQICEFIDGTVIIGSQQTTSFSVLTLKDLKQKINEVISPFTDEEFKNVIDYLSLSYRGSVDKKPDGFEYYDIMPWRFNRRLSLLRKPLVLLNNSNDSDNPFVYWGFRQVLLSRRYLGEQIIENRLRVNDAGSVSKAMGKIAGSEGDYLVSKIQEKLSNTGIIVDTSVFIGPKFELFNDSDIGDIDVLVIDTINKFLFSIECKNLSPSRNIKEMVEEVAKLVESGGLIDKHLRRDDWIRNNISTLEKKYKVDLSGYTVKSVFVTTEDMLTPYLHKNKLPIPFLTSYEIDNNGIEILKKI